MNENYDVERNNNQIEEQTDEVLATEDSDGIDIKGAAGAAVVVTLAVIGLVKLGKWAYKKKKRYDAFCEWEKEMEYQNAVDADVYEEDYYDDIVVDDADEVNEE